MRRRDVSVLVASLVALSVLTAGCFRYLHVDTAPIVALSFLLVVLLAAAMARLWVPVTVSLAAVLLFNYFFLEPIGTFYLANPGEWVALAAFLVVSLVASNLSAAARARTAEAIARQRELACLFHVSRDVLAITDTSTAMRQLADSIQRRFGLEFVALCLPSGDEWQIVTAGSRHVPLTPALLVPPTGPPAHTVTIGDTRVHCVPMQRDATSGLLAVAGRPIGPAMLDALAGVAAIAIERARFLEARTAADIARRGEELKSALLASLGHDLRTPLTAIRIAAGNLRTSSQPVDANQAEQIDLIVTEVARLNRHFDNILDMARIETGAIAPAIQWVHPTDIFEAARDQAQTALGGRRLDVRADADDPIQLDPRLTASALARVLENAAQYSPADSTIAVTFEVSSSDLTITVRDHGRGLAPGDLPHLFDRFFRGAESGRRSGGAGMGLSIARGLVEAVHGRIHADNCPDGGARFTIVVPAVRKNATPVETPS
jgi:two-component system, OmpR family, sensor histidine kinase KdpD